MPRHLTDRDALQQDAVGIMQPPASHLATDLPAIAGGIPVRSLSEALIFGAPVITSAEIDSVSECLRSKWIGAGARVHRFEREFACYKNAPHAVAVSSGTAALHLAMVALGIGPGDEVIAPTMTFCSTVHSIVYTGATLGLAARQETRELSPLRLWFS